MFKPKISRKQIIRLKNRTPWIDCLYDCKKILTQSSNMQISADSTTIKKIERYKVKTSLDSNGKLV